MLRRTQSFVLLAPRKEKDPFGRNVTDWIPTMEKKTKKYHTKQDPLDLKALVTSPESGGSSRGSSSQLATTLPFIVQPCGSFHSANGGGLFGPVAFHSFLYGPGATSPYRPLVLRAASSANVKSTQEVTALSRGLFEEQYHGTEGKTQRRQGAGAVGEEDMMRTWMSLDSKKTLKIIPAVGFEVTKRLGVDLLQFPVEDIRQVSGRPLFMAPLVKAGVNLFPPSRPGTSAPPLFGNEQQQQQEEATSHATATPSTDNMKHVLTESIFQVLHRTSIKVKVSVPKHEAQRVAMMNLKRAAAGELSPLGRAILHKQGGSGPRIESYATKDTPQFHQVGLNGDYSTSRLNYEFTLHQGDLCFLPRGWGYQFHLVSTGGIDSQDVEKRLGVLKRAGFSNEEQQWPREAWEPDCASLDEAASRVSRTPNEGEDGRDRVDDISLPFMVLRHYYKAFPVLTEQQAALKRSENFKEVSSFYQSQMPKVPPQLPVTVTDRNSQPQPFLERQHV